MREGMAGRAGIGEGGDQHIAGKAGERINVADHGISSLGDEDGMPVGVASIARRVGSMAAILGPLAGILGSFPDGDAVFCLSSVGSLHICERARVSGWRGVGVRFVKSGALSRNNYRTPLMADAAAAVTKNPVIRHKQGS